MTNRDLKDYGLVLAQQKRAEKINSVLGFLGVITLILVSSLKI
jgi:hypothetical protein